MRLAMTILTLMLSTSAFALEATTKIQVLTYHNDNARSSVNANETKLTLTNVKAGAFGKLFRDTVDGQVFAGPLYVSGLVIKGTIQNVVLVATENNSVYAFDADKAGAPLWQVN